MGLSFARQPHRRLKTFMKLRYILAFFILTIFVSAKADSVKNQLQEAYRLYYQEDETNARSILNNIPENLISIQNDTLQFQYYYLKAGLMDIPSEYGDAYNSAMAKQRRYIETAIDLMESRLNVHNSQYLELMYQMADFYKLFDGDIDKAIIAYEKALVIGMYPKALGDEATNYWYGNIFWQLASLYELKGYEKQLISLYKNVENVLPPDGDIPQYMGYILLASYYDKHERYIDAMEANTHILSMVEAKEGKQSINYVQTLKSIGSNQSKAGLYIQAIETFLTAIAVAENNTSCSEEIPEIYAELCIAYLSEKNRAKEAEIYQLVYKDSQERQDNSTYLNLTYSCAQKHLELNEYRLAQEYNNNLLTLEKVINKKVLALALLQRSKIESGMNSEENGLFFAKWAADIVSSDDCVIAIDDKLDIYLHLCNAYNAKGMYDDCLTILDKIVDLFSEGLCNDDDMFNYIVGYIANCHIAQKDYESARNIYNTYLTEILEPTDYSRIADTHNKLGVVELLDSNPVQAHTYLDLSWAFFKTTVGENTTEHIYYLHNKGRAYMLQGKTKEAIKYLAQSKAIQLSLNGEVMERTQQYLNELGAQ